MSNNTILNCLIVDDEPIAIQGIRAFIAKVDFLHEVSACHSALEASRILHEQHIDLMFLDINMPNLSGIDFLTTLKEPPLTILTTAYSEYALEGYQLNVIDYLLKPISFPRFFQASQKALYAYSAKVELSTKQIEAEDIFIKQGDAYIRIYLKDILYIESMQNYIKIFLSDNMYMVHQTLVAMENVLPSTSFFRIHKSYLVNLSAIRAIVRNTVQIGTQELPISKYRKEELLAILVHKKGVK